MEKKEQIQALSTVFFSDLEKNEANEKSIKILEENKKYGVRIVTIVDPEYPRFLKNSYNYPLILFVMGNVPQGDWISFIGSREISSTGIKITKKMVEEFCVKDNMVCVTGLARGVDTIAAQTARRVVGYLPCPINTVYPPENMNLFEEILSEKGCLISEIPIGFSFNKQSFLDRNRLITGSSLAVVVPEMGPNSGTTHAVHCGILQTKPVFIANPSIEADYQSFEWMKSITKLDFENSMKSIFKFKNNEIQSSFEEMKKANLISSKEEPCVFAVKGKSDYQGMRKIINISKKFHSGKIF